MPRAFEISLRAIVLARSRRGNGGAGDRILELLRPEDVDKRHAALGDSMHVQGGIVDGGDHVDGGFVDADDIEAGLAHESGLGVRGKCVSRDSGRRFRSIGRGRFFNAVVAS